MTKPASSKITRIEVVDDTGEHTAFRRVYVRYGVSVELSYQDDGRTLKVFVRSRGAEAEQQTKAEMAEGLRQFIGAVKTRPRREPIIDQTKIAKAMKAAGEKVRKEGPSDGRFRKTRGR